MCSRIEKRCLARNPPGSFRGGTAIGNHMFTDRFLVAQFDYPDALDLPDSRQQAVRQLQQLHLTTPIIGQNQILTS